MATELQREYIGELAIKKLKEFKEFKELLLANGIVKPDTETINMDTIEGITDRLTDKQASDVIDLLIAREEPYRDTKYADARIKRVINLLDDIKKDIDDWSF